MHSNEATLAQHINTRMTSSSPLFVKISAMRIGRLKKPTLVSIVRSIEQDLIEKDVFGTRSATKQYLPQSSDCPLYHAFSHFNISSLFQGRTRSFESETESSSLDAPSAQSLTEGPSRPIDEKEKESRIKELDVKHSSILNGSSTGSCNLIDPQSESDLNNGWINDFDYIDADWSMKVMTILIFRQWIQSLVHLFTNMLKMKEMWISLQGIFLPL